MIERLMGAAGPISFFSSSYFFKGLQEHYVVLLIEKKQSWSKAESMNANENIDHR
jgi:hypothetical protein